MNFPQWRGLWDWSMKYADGTEPSRFRPEDVDPDKMKWLDDALKHYMVDFSARMKDIKKALERDTRAGGDAGTGAASDADIGSKTSDQDGAFETAASSDLKEREALLEELMDIVSSIDYARDLHKIGGLPVLLELLSSSHPSLQWRAAEVVATCVANNPPVQQWFLDGAVLPHLMALTGPSQPDGTVRSKALLALSGLVRHFAPGLEALSEAGGLGLLVTCLGASDHRVTRKAMTLLTYFLSKRRADCVAALTAGALSPLVAELDGGVAAHIKCEGDTQAASDLRQAALSVLVQLATHPDTWKAVRDAPGLQGRLVELMAAHGALTVEDQEAQAEEMLLLSHLAELLAAPAPPPALPQEAHDDVSVEAFEETGRGTTFAVNEPRAGAGVRDAGVGSGIGDQGTTPLVMAGRVNSVGDGEGATVTMGAAHPLLLGAPQLGADGLD